MLSDNLLQFTGNWIVWAIIILALGCYILLLNFIFSPKDESWRKNCNYWFTAFPVMLSALPLLGLLGTIVGLMQTFREMGSGGGIDLETMLSSGVADALVTTQMGLVMVIPGWLLLTFLKYLDHKAEINHAS